ncbi:hypothetical protein Tco_0818625 [Tanacetum coccineum]
MPIVPRFSVDGTPIKEFKNAESRLLKNAHKAQAMTDLKSCSAHLTTFRTRYYMEGVGLDSESVGRTTRERIVEVRHLLVIRDNVKEVMFYD